MTGYDRRKARRLIQAGAVARDQLLALPAAFIAERDHCDALVNRVRRLAGWDVDPRDVLRFDDRTLYEIGLKRGAVALAVEALDDLEDLRKQMAETRAALEPKMRLANKLRDWIDLNHRSVA